MLSAVVVDGEKSPISWRMAYLFILASARMRKTHGAIIKLHIANGNATVVSYSSAGKS